MCGLDWSFITCGIKGRTFTVGQTTLKIMTNKMVKHEKACSSNQYIFIPFIFDTFDFLALENVLFIHLMTY